MASFQTTLLALVLTVSSASAQLLIDGSGLRAAALSSFANALPAEELSAGAIGTVNSIGSSIAGLAGSASQSLSLIQTAGSMNGGWSGGVFADGLLQDYYYTTGTATLSLTGLVDSSGNPIEFSSSNSGSSGSSFTLKPNQTYRLYLIGAGDSNNQESVFTFEGESKTTSPLIVGTAADADHAVSFEFTTGPDLTGFALDFTITTSSFPNGDFAAFNGLAIVELGEAVDPTRGTVIMISSLSGWFLLAGLSLFLARLRSQA
jgi:hypothetical protein